MPLDVVKPYLERRTHLRKPAMQLNYRVMMYTGQYQDMIEAVPTIDDITDSRG